MQLRQAFGVFDLDGARQIEITNFYVHTFFDVHLNGASSATLTMQPPAYPEVLIE